MADEINRNNDMYSWFNKVGYNFFYEFLGLD